MKDTVAVLLAAGRGTRMKSEMPKVMHEILGRPMIRHIADSIRGAGVSDIIVVAGYRAELLKDAAIRPANVITQKELLGSGDAVNAARRLLEKFTGDLLIVYGDTPLIQDETIRNLIARHKRSGAAATILTAELKDPTGYGRVIRGDDGEITRIVEEAQANLYEEVINEINAGLYCFKVKDLFEALRDVRPKNRKKEYYLTDVIGILSGKGKAVKSIAPRDNDEVIGVNTRAGLAEASGLLRKRISERLMSDGVTIEDPDSTTIYPDVKIGSETVIRPNTIIESDVEIGRCCRIGPFAHIRRGVQIDDRAEIGNFVELVRTKVGSGTRIKHHSYIGDAIVGKDVNVGAGTITANYDGRNKNRTTIEDGAFIGVGAILIAPVRIGRGAVVGAGCVVPKNHDVPSGATVVGVPARILKGNTKKRRKGCAINS